MRRFFKVALICFIVIFLFVSVSFLIVTNTDGNKDSVRPVTVKYDVFVSFSGLDVRREFLSHLVKALSEKAILVYVDYMLEKGDEILASLMKAIETSSASVVIFSPNYASSAWCLDELVKIVQCRQIYGQVILPVFYKLQPTMVRKQNGTYATAFAEHEKKYDTTRVQQWRSALKYSADISGYPSLNYTDDAKLVEEIVKSVLKELHCVKRFDSKGLVGIDKRISDVESLLQTGSKDIPRAIGIWGMSGIGKTTIAEQVYNRLRCHYDYEGFCFIARVKDESERRGIMSLKKQLYTNLLRDQHLKIETQGELPDNIKWRLLNMKVLVVLDDVDDYRKQLEILIGSKIDNWFGNGSRIIITSGDKQVLEERVDDIYEVKPLEFNDSLRLFNLNAFELNQTHQKDYKELSKMMVKYAEGNPLVLKVLGRLLRGKDKERWEDYLGGLIPIKTVHQIFISSFNDLDRNEKKIFLDIACFFNGLRLKVKDIQLLVKDSSYSMSVELESLQNKALITISPDSVVSMHNIIKQSALVIVSEESNGVYEKQSRLLNPADISDVLKNNKGSEAIRSLAIDVSIIKELQLHPKVFANMNKLRYLDIYSKGYFRDFVQSRRGLYLPQGLESLPNELRYLRWVHFPFESLPNNFSGEKLVVLDLQYSNQTQLWFEDYKELANLKYLNLDSSVFLAELPDLSNATNLEIIDLRLCTRLKSVHPSVFTLNKLKKLDLGGCFALESLKSDIHLTSLRYLSLAGCYALKEFSVTSKEMVKLNLEHTGIKQLPSSIRLQTKLEKLLLTNSSIENLPESIKNLTRLSHLGLQNCTELRSLPELPSSLIILDASGCVSLENVDFPSTAHQMLNENKTRVAFWNCLKLNQHSLHAIQLNAQINMMKFIHQDISISRDHDYVAQGTYVYPGSIVPEWLLYRTTHDNMTIGLSFGNHSSPLGFIFGFIVPQVPSGGFILRFNIEIDEGEEDIQLYLDRPRQKIRSDHVCLIYYRSFSRYLSSRIKDQTKFKIKVTAESQTLTLTRQYVPMILKGFGVSPINTSQYLNFVQPMEMAEGPSILSSLMFVNIFLILVFVLLVVRMYVH